MPGIKVVGSLLRTGMSGIRTVNLTGNKYRNHSKSFFMFWTARMDSASIRAQNRQILIRNRIGNITAKIDRKRVR